VTEELKIVVTEEMADTIIDALNVLEDKDGGIYKGHHPVLDYEGQCSLYCTLSDVPEEGFDLTFDQATLNTTLLALNCLQETKESPEKEEIISLIAQFKAVGVYEATEETLGGIEQAADLEEEVLDLFEGEAPPARALLLLNGFSNVATALKQMSPAERGRLTHLLTQLTS
jgi:hypothetical protein